MLHASVWDWRACGWCPDQGDAGVRRRPCSCVFGTNHHMLILPMPKLLFPHPHSPSPLGPQPDSLSRQVTLNQTNIGQNNNKFYIIQLLEADAGGKWWVWTRWARVGQVCTLFLHAGAGQGSHDW